MSAAAMAFSMHSTTRPSQCPTTETQIAQPARGVVQQQEHSSVVDCCGHPLHTSMSDWEQQAEAAAGGGKLNPGAKSFSFNPNARSFVPGGSSGAPAPSTEGASPSSSLTMSQSIVVLVVLALFGRVRCDAFSRIEPGKSSCTNL